MKLPSGSPFPTLTLPLLSGGDVTIGRATQPDFWQIVIVYRGLHCPLCKKYLTRLEELREGFAKAKAEVVVVSADPKERAAAMVAETGLTLPVAYGLTTDQMQTLGLYISRPRSDDETDRPFAEPATFAINETGILHLIELSNTPFNRADLGELVETVEWVRENEYPVRGTWPD